jgi:hypothetical protein
MGFDKKLADNSLLLWAAARVSPLMSQRVFPLFERASSKKRRLKILFRNAIAASYVVMIAS